MNIGLKIKNKRTELGMTQEYLAKKIGATKQAVYKYENGIVTNIPIDRLQKIADTLKVSIEYLTGWGTKNDQWSESFCQSLLCEIQTIDPADFAEAGIDIQRWKSIASGEIPLSLSEACTIADELGTSLDDMVGLSHTLTEEEEYLLDKFRELSEQGREYILQTMNMASNTYKKAADPLDKDINKVG